MCLPNPPVIPRSEARRNLGFPGHAKNPDPSLRSGRQTGTLPAIRGETLSCLARNCITLQRAQEVQNFLLLRGTEAIEIVLHRGGFAAIAGVGLDGRVQVGGAAIVQQKDPLPQAP